LHGSLFMKNKQEKSNYEIPELGYFF